MEKVPVIVIGATGGCADIADLLSSGLDKYELHGFLDNNKEAIGENVFGYSVLDSSNNISNYCNYKFAIGVGSESNFKNKPEIISKLGLNKNNCINVIHNSAYISNYSKIGYGCIIHPNCYVGPNVEIGNFVHILPNTVIGHDSVVGDYTIINSQCVLAGGVTIKQNCYIGAGVKIKQNIKIGKKCLIGMGSLVLKDIQEDTTSFGHPAKVYNYDK